MSGTKYIANEETLPPYTPYPIVETPDYSWRAATYRDVSSSQSASQSTLNNCKTDHHHHHQSKRKKDKQSKKTQRLAKSREMEDTKQRYEATLNFLQKNDLLDVTMKTIELEKRHDTIKRKMDQLQSGSITYCNV